MIVLLKSRGPMRTTLQATGVMFHEGERTTAAGQTQKQNQCNIGYDRPLDSNQTAGAAIALYFS